MYLTYDGDKPENQMKWFKIWAEHDCKSMTIIQIILLIIILTITYTYD